MALKKCDICDGEGVIDRDGKFVECKCAYVRRLLSSMPVYIRKTQIMKEHLNLPLIKDWRKHYMITASWADMRALIKAWMIMNDKKLLQITSDREIKEVFVGNKSRTDGETEYLTARYNSIEDLVDPADVLVIKFNELGYKNKAAPGALEEAINYRLDRDKITWVFNDVRRPFGNSSFCYSDSLADVIAAGFRSVVIQPILKEVDAITTLMNNVAPLQVRPLAQRESILELDPVQDSPGLAPKKPIKMKAPRPVVQESEPVEEVVDDLSSIYGAGIKKKKKSW